MPNLELMIYTNVFGYEQADYNMVLALIRPQYHVLFKEWSDTPMSPVMREIFAGNMPFYQVLKLSCSRHSICLKCIQINYECRVLSNFYIRIIVRCLLFKVHWISTHFAISFPYDSF